jgi:formylglycine-generating enzyme
MQKIAIVFLADTPLADGLERVVNDLIWIIRDMRYLKFVALLGMSLLGFVTLAYSADIVKIPAGTFLMGCSSDDQECEQDEGLPGGINVFVPSFYIDPFEVTVAEYQACVTTGKCAPPKTHTRNKYCNYGATGRERYPVNCVDWPDAVNYCTLQGKRLPLEAEWEKAARAGSSATYIWDTAPNCAQAILNDGKTTGSVQNELDGCGEDRTWPVGARPANAFGLYDMYGNVSEWVQNWFHPDAMRFYADGKLKAPTSGQRKVIRGGAWDEPQRALRNSSRYAKTPVSGTAVWGSNGFRCAKSDNHH